MPNREHARRLMLILLANDADRQSFRLAQDAPAPEPGGETASERPSRTPEATDGQDADWRMWDDFTSRALLAPPA